MHWSSPTLHKHSENKVQGRTAVSSENIVLWWQIYQKMKADLPDSEMSTLYWWRKGPQKGHYVTINVIPYSPEIGYFQSHYLDITFKDPLNRKDLSKKWILKLIQFMKGRPSQLGPRLSYQLLTSAEILRAGKMKSLDKVPETWCIMYVSSQKCCFLSVTRSIATVNHLKQYLDMYPNTSEVPALAARVDQWALKAEETRQTWGKRLISENRAVSQAIIITANQYWCDSVEDDKKFCRSCLQKGIWRKQI